MPRLIFVVAASFTRRPSGIRLRCALARSRKISGSCTEKRTTKAIEAGHETDKEHAAPADQRQQNRRDQRRHQHAGLPAERDIGAAARACLRRPSFGDQRHADAELAAEAEPGDGAVDQADPSSPAPGAHRPVKIANNRMVQVSTRTRP